MRAYEFNTTANEDAIVIPEKYRGKISAKVRVIVLQEADTHDATLERAINMDEFNDIQISTKGYRFNREEANAR